MARHEDAGETPPETKEAVKPEVLVWLDPAKLSFYWKGGAEPVRMTVAGDRSYPRVFAAYAFPHSDPKHFIQLFEGKPDGNRGEVIGMLHDCTALSEADRKAVDEALGRAYIVPRILRILHVNDMRYLVHWAVQTDRGASEFDMNDIYEQIDRREDGRIMLTDTYGNRYEIPSLKALDPESQKLLEPFL
ncbi:MAG: DUF1854 domain-containing protein [Planctomycetota bacterium]|nr:DUF1854 domain-containing protein [Planctomycetota bacterium]